MLGFGESNKFFAFNLGRDLGQNRSIDSPNASFTIGELDPEIATDPNTLSYTPVFRSGDSAFDYWKLPLHGITINSMIFPLSPSLVPDATTPIAVLDTGTTLILGPTADVSAFWSSMGGGDTVRKNAISEMWEVRCNRGVVVGLILGENDSKNEYPIHPRDMSWQEGGNSDGWCLGGIQANDQVNSGDWLLGDIFLRNVYVTHHFGTSSQPPYIGLLNLTNPSNAMSEFSFERGPDNAPSPSIRPLSALLGPTRTRPATVATLSSVGGFFSGLILTILFRLLHSANGTKGRHIVHLE